MYPIAKLEPYRFEEVKRGSPNHRKAIAARLFYVMKRREI